MPNPTQSNGSLARLKRRLQKAGIRQQTVAEAAGVTKVHVCNVLAGRDQSQKVVETAKRLLADHQNGAQEPGEGRPTRGILQNAGAS